MERWKRQLNPSWTLKTKGLQECEAASDTATCVQLSWRSPSAMALLVWTENRWKHSTFPTVTLLLENFTWRAANRQLAKTHSVSVLQAFTLRFLSFRELSSLFNITSHCCDLFVLFSSNGSWFHCSGISFSSFKEPRGTKYSLFFKGRSGEN